MLSWEFALRRGKAKVRGRGIIRKGPTGRMTGRTFFIENHDQTKCTFSPASVRPDLNWAIG